MRRIRIDMPDPGDSTQGSICDAETGEVLLVESMTLDISVNRPTTATFVLLHPSPGRPPRRTLEVAEVLPARRDEGG